MATSQIGNVIQQVRKAVLLRDGAGLTDGQLLEAYVSRRDEAALAALVRRHGPMVWGVCHRLVRNHHDAEDAFQATFLVLVRKAATVASRELLANWLYGVAYNTALKARATAAKRCARERQVTKMPEPEVVEHDQFHDLLPLLERELSRLPDNYRAVIVLFDLEGKTRKEVARQLGLPEGTVAGRLARARAMLAKRLAPHGLVVSDGALAALLSEGAASASMPTSLVVSTAKAASLFAAGQAAGAISANVAALTEGVLKTMLLSKLVKIGVALLLTVVVLGLGASGLAYRSQAADPPAKKKDEKQSTASAEDKKQAGFRQQLQAVEWAVSEVSPDNKTISLMDYQAFVGENGLALVKNKDIPAKEGDVPPIGLVLEKVPLVENVKVIVDGRNGKLADLKPGMRVSVQFSEGKAEVTKITAKSYQLVAVLKVVNQENRTITVTGWGKQTLEELPVKDDARIMIREDGNLSRFRDLKAGMLVQFRLKCEDGKIVVTDLVAEPADK